MCIFDPIFFSLMMFKLTLVLLFCLDYWTLSATKEQRFIFYDVNPGEGFNLRRDVFIRMAVMVHKLNLQSDKFSYVLVLPPWGPLYHWQTPGLGDQSKLPWKLFFDIASIHRYVPCMDLEDYLKLHSPSIDTVFYLQNYAGGWTNGEFKEKMDVQECLRQPPYIREDDGHYKGQFWNFRQLISSKKMECLSIQGTTQIMAKFLEDQALKYQSFMLDRAENLLHDYFGDDHYWSARRSMRFSQQLLQIANDFRAKELNSTDEKDVTMRADKWENYLPQRGSAKGGPFICAHLRRKDFTFSRKDQIPDLESAAQQLKRKCQEQKVTNIFVATDAPLEEFQLLKSFLADFNVVRYLPSMDVLNEVKDGGVAIIDQIICSHAKYFIGSVESTFSFRIQEEREIMGFAVENTFDMLCKTGQFDCQKGSIWKIVYPPKKSHTEL